MENSRSLDKWIFELFDIGYEKPQNLTKTEQHKKGTPSCGIRSTLHPQCGSHQAKLGGPQSSPQVMGLHSAIIRFIKSTLETPMSLWGTTLHNVWCFTWSLIFIANGAVQTLSIESTSNGHIF